MLETSRHPKVAIFNVKGMRNELSQVDEQEKEVTVMGTCKTWVKGGNHPLKESLDRWAAAPYTGIQSRRYGAAGVIMNPLIQYSMIGRYETNLAQYAPARRHGLVINVVYVSRKARKT